MIFTGERPASEIPDLLAAADVLVSPRSRGTNTPLKIYQYLRSGRVIVATRLLTHTQVLDDGVAILTDATPAASPAGSCRRSAIRRRPRGSATRRRSWRPRSTATRPTWRARAKRSAGSARIRGRRSPGAPRDRARPSRTRPDHYSYAIYADPAMADSFDRARFGGPVGELLAETQARILTEFCGPLDGRDAIDVGTGTAARRWSSPGPART